MIRPSQPQSFQRSHLPRQRQKDEFNHQSRPSSGALSTIDIIANISNIAVMDLFDMRQNDKNKDHLCPPDDP